MFYGDAVIVYVNRWTHFSSWNSCQSQNSSEKSDWNPTTERERDRDKERKRDIYGQTNTGHDRNNVLGK